MDGAPVNALVDLWNEEITWAIDWIAPWMSFLRYLIDLLRGCGQWKDKGGGKKMGRKTQD